jgi:hypothetical protein
MRDRQHAVRLIRWRHAALRAHYPGAEQHIAVSQHHPLGIAGRARGIEECGDLARPIGLDWFRHGLLVQQADAEGTQCVEFGNGGAVAARMLARVVGDLDRVEDAAGAAVIPNKIDLAL